MNDAAIVTGASSGIGLEISKMLCRRGYEVFGIGRNFDPAHESDHFHPIVCDILDTDNLCDTVKKLRHSITYRYSSTMPAPLIMACMRNLMPGRSGKW